MFLFSIFVLRCEKLSGSFCCLSLERKGWIKKSFVSVHCYVCDDTQSPLYDYFFVLTFKGDRVFWILFKIQVSWTNWAYYTVHHWRTVSSAELIVIKNGAFKSDSNSKLISCSNSSRGCRTASNNLLYSCAHCDRHRHGWSHKYNTNSRQEWVYIDQYNYEICHDQDSTEFHRVLYASSTFWE